MYRRKRVFLFYNHHVVVRFAGDAFRVIVFCIGLDSGHFENFVVVITNGLIFFG